MHVKEKLSVLCTGCPVKKTRTRRGAQPNAVMGKSFPLRNVDLEARAQTGSCGFASSGADSTVLDTAATQLFSKDSICPNQSQLPRTTRA
jgi:hypothetical protein